MEVMGDAVAWFAEGAHWRGPGGVPARLWEHLVLSVVPLLLAVAAALPVGVLLGHLRKGGLVAVNVANIGRAVPSFAVLVLALQALGFGRTPAYVALFALAVPPILTNAYVGLAGVDDDVIESARGMGMTGLEVLRRVELPLAVPLVMAGIRTSAVQVVATATLGAYIAQGGLGRYIVDGYAQRDFGQVVAGALLVSALAVLTEVGLGAVQRATVPRGLVIAPAGAVPDEEDGGAVVVDTTLGAGVR